MYTREIYYSTEKGKSILSRDISIWKEYKTGEISQIDLAKKYGITKVRVHQIISKIVRDRFYNNLIN